MAYDPFAPPPPKTAQVMPNPTPLAPNNALAPVGATATQTAAPLPNTQFPLNFFHRMPDHVRGPHGPVMSPGQRGGDEPSLGFGGAHHNQPTWMNLLPQQQLPDHLAGQVAAIRNNRAQALQNFRANFDPATIAADWRARFTNRAGQSATPPVGSAASPINPLDV